MKYLSDDDYNFIYSNVPRICIDIVIKNELGILLTKRDAEPFLGYWHTPGGRIRFRETIEQAVKRISFAELGVSVNPVKLLGVVELLDEVQNGNDRHSITLYYECACDTEIKGDYFNDLPENTIPQQKKFLESI